MAAIFIPDVCHCPLAREKGTTRKGKHPLQNAPGIIVAKRTSFVSASDRAPDHRWPDGTYSIIRDI